MHFGLEGPFWATTGGFVVAIGLGSVTGSVVGGLMLGVVSEDFLVPLMALLLVYSSIKVWRHA
jgi:uncharacterized protein